MKVKNGGVALKNLTAYGPDGALRLNPSLRPGETWTIEHIIPPAELGTHPYPFRVTAQDDNNFMKIMKS